MYAKDRAIRAIGRAEAMTKVKTKYILGAGGRNPDSAYPHGYKGPIAHKKIGCDCSGFVCWALGFDRYQPGKFPLYGGWMNTDAIIEDAMGKQGFWVAHPFPVEGCAVIYPGTTRKGKRVAIGHMGLVTYVPTNLGPNWREFPEEFEVIDCAASLVRRISGYAIGRKTLGLWAGKEGTVFASPRSDI